MELLFNKIEDFLKSAYYRAQRRFDDTPLEEMSFTVVDLETTGFHTPPQDRIIEIGALRLDNLQVISEFSTLVNPMKPIPEIATEVTGITTKDVRNAMKIGKALNEFFRFAEGSIIVAYNVAFDYQFISTSSKLCTGYIPQHKTLCAFELSRKLLYFVDRLDLDNVAEYFDISIENRHRALGDARATAKIFLRLLELLKMIGVRRYSDAKLLEINNLLPRETRKLLEHYRRLGVI